MEQKENERKKYEKEINTITETVEGMAAQVAALLEDNSSLPERDRLDRWQEGRGDGDGEGELNGEVQDQEQVLKMRKIMRRRRRRIR